eukprot:15467583-Alexandrium_andersonii.AAC.1
MHNATAGMRDAALGACSMTRSALWACAAPVAVAPQLDPAVYALVGATTCTMLRLRLLGVPLERLTQRHAERRPLLEHMLQPVAACGIELYPRSDLI